MGVESRIEFCMKVNGLENWNRVRRRAKYSAFAFVHSDSIASGILVDASKRNGRR